MSNGYDRANDARRIRLPELECAFVTSALTAMSADRATIAVGCDERLKSFEG
jgi:hypothetical protein